ncbi:OmpA family protein [Chondromyces crocatus]|nr:OmpA family protein [Chondromyces crocatus]
MAACAAAMLGGATAHGQESTALDRFDPAPAGDAFFTVPSAGVPGHLQAAGAAAISYAHQPLSLRRESDEEALSWVSRQLVLHALASVELFERVKVDLDLPLLLEQGGTSGELGGRSVVAPSGASVGDLRVGARVALLAQEGGYPAAALRLSVWLPTAGGRAFAGADSARFAPALVVGGDHTRWLWSVTVGGRLSPRSENSLTGSETFGGAAAALRFGGLQVGPEILVAASTGSLADGQVRQGFSAEALLGARYTVGPVTFGAGGGPGLGRTPGTPAFRVFGAISVAGELLGGGKADGALAHGSAGRPEEGKGRADEQRKGSTGGEGAASAGQDQDGDGVMDADDVCPTQVGVDQPPRRGCPPDQDGDGIADADDRCPTEAGVASTEEARHGCPPDSDGDGIVDALDACPAERGEATQDPQTNGCPRAVRVESSQIVILQQVNFATGKADILQESFDVLEQVARALGEHPEIARVAVDGHTDAQGAEKPNLDLSRRRALSVVTWLIEHGVDARRLEARGFGPRRPIADNATAGGRAKNRRVEFQIRRRTTEGAAGWRDGPVED